MNPDTMGNLAKVQTASVTRVLLLDEQPVVRRGLRAALDEEPDMHVVAEADTTDAVRKILAVEDVDVLVVEIAAGGFDGLDFVKELAADRKDVTILVFSGQDERLYAQRVLRAGARGYLPKSVSLDSVVEGVRTARAGRVVLSEAAADRMLRQMADGSVEEELTPLELLSDRELEVFRALGKGLGTRAIAQNLGLSPKTIETYRENIKAKLDLRDANELVHAAVRWVADRG